MATNFFHFMGAANGWSKFHWIPTDKHASNSFSIASALMITLSTVDPPTACLRQTSGVAVQGDRHSRLTE
jgi:hypothetical protein